MSKPLFSTHCLICGEKIALYNPTAYPLVCENCKDAVMHVRKQIEIHPERTIKVKDVEEVYFNEK